MANRRDGLIKLAARVTTAAGDTSAITGTSISEILEFMTDNLNVDANGALIVSELKLPVVSGGGGLLPTSVTLIDENGGQIFENKDFVLGLEADKKYEVSANVDGQDVVIYTTAKSEPNIGGALQLKPDTGDYPALIENSVGLICYDAVSFIGGQVAASDSNCILGLIALDSQPHTVVINSITEV